MASRIVKSLVLSDDLTGEERDGIETIVFAWKGRVLSIDLTEENAKEFESAVEPFASRAREVPKAHLLRTLPKGRAGRPVRREVEPAAAPEALAGSEPILKPRQEPQPEPETQGTPETEQGKESETLSAPLDTPVTPQGLSPSDFQASNPNEIPAAWAPAQPTLGDTMDHKAQKTKMWAVLMGRAIVGEPTMDDIRDWLAFYDQKVWLVRGR